MNACMSMKRVYKSALQHRESDKLLDLALLLQSNTRSLTPRLLHLIRESHRKQNQKKKKKTHFNNLKRQKTQICSVVLLRQGVQEVNVTDSSTTATTTKSKSLNP